MHFRVAMSIMLLAGSAHAADVSYGQTKAWADRDEKSLSPALSQKLIESQARVMKDVLPACTLSIPHPGGHPDLAPFAVVMQLDASGRVVRTWLHGTTPLAECFNRQIGSKSLFAPPKVPFYTSIELNLKDGGASR